MHCTGKMHLRPPGSWYLVSTRCVTGTKKQLSYNDTSLGLVLFVFSLVWMMLLESWWSWCSFYCELCDLLCIQLEASSVIWLIHTWGRTQSYVKHDSFIRETWLIHECIVASTCMTWLILTNETWIILPRETRPILTYETWPIFTCATWLLHTCEPWLILTCATWLLFTRETWLIFTCLPCPYIPPNPYNPYTLHLMPALPLHTCSMSMLIGGAVAFCQWWDIMCCDIYWRTYCICVCLVLLRVF